MASHYFAPLNARKRKYLEGVTRGLSKTEAKRLAGYSESTQPCKIETPQLKAQFARLIRQHVPAHVLAKRIAEGVDAKETKFFQFEGKVTDQRDVVAWGPRATFAKIAAEWGQYVEPDGPKVSIGEGGPTFVLINGITKRKE
jgi:phage terminase small subunit